jgi:hypothetical protein
MQNTRKIIDLRQQMHGRYAEEEGSSWSTLFYLPFSDN